MDKDVNLYKGVGKMYALRRLDNAAYSLSQPRFLMVPRDTMEKDLQSQEKDLTEDINNLSKKVNGL